MSLPIHTFQTRLNLSSEAIDAFAQMGELFSRVERSLFADIQSGKKATDLKSSYLTRFQITARQFNACRVQVQGLIASRKRLQQEQIQSLKQALQALEQKIQRLEKKRCKTSLFWKKQKREKLLAKCKKLQIDQKKGIVRVCFGTKKLFSSQFHLAHSGFSDFISWKQAWETSRKNHFFS